MKPVGSEKLPVDLKVKRIMEIANYGNKPTIEESKISTVHFEKGAANGEKYLIVKERTGYIVKESNEGNPSYIGGLRNSKKYTFKSYSQALKKLNLMMKPINEEHNEGKGISMFGEQEKFVLKTPEEETPEEDFSDMDELGGDELEGGDDLAGLEGGDDLEGLDDMDTDMDLEGGEEGDAEPTQDPTKSIQKLTGKLGQKLRDVEDDVDGDLVKYVVNSVLSALDLEKLDPEDKDEIIEKIEGDEEVDYSEEGEFEVDMEGDEEFDMEGDEEFDMEGGEEIEVEDEMPETYEPGHEEESNEGVKSAMVGAVTGYAAEKAIDKLFGESKVSKTITKYFEESNSEKNRKSKSVDSFLKNKLTTLIESKKLENKFKSVDQEITTKKFLKENKDYKFVGNDNVGSLFFKSEKDAKIVDVAGKIK